MIASPSYTAPGNPGLTLPASTVWNTLPRHHETPLIGKHPGQGQHARQPDEPCMTPADEEQERRQYPSQKHCTTPEQAPERPLRDKAGRIVRIVSCMSHPELPEQHDHVQA